MVFTVKDTLHSKHLGYLWHSNNRLHIIIRQGIRLVGSEYSFPSTKILVLNNSMSGLHKPLKAMKLVCHW